MTLETWKREVDQIWERRSAGSWRLADLLLEANSTDWKDAAWAHAISLGYRARTLRRLIQTARRFPIELRHVGLSFSHHQVVDGLPSDEADKLLTQAGLQHWSFHRLVGASRVIRAAQPPKKRHGPGTFTADLSRPLKAQTTNGAKPRDHHIYRPDEGLFRTLNSAIEDIKLGMKAFLGREPGYREYALRSLDKAAMELRKLQEIMARSLKKPQSDGRKEMVH